MNRARKQVGLPYPDATAETTFGKVDIETVRRADLLTRAVRVCSRSTEKDYVNAPLKSGFEREAFGAQRIYLGASTMRVEV